MTLDDGNGGGVRPVDALHLGGRISVPAGLLVGVVRQVGPTFVIQIFSMTGPCAIT